MRTDTIKRQLIRLADAMMAGGKKRQQCSGQLFDLITKEELKKGNWVTRYKLGGSCALGAVYEGLFGTPPIVLDDDNGAKINGGEGEMYARLGKKLPVLDLLLSDITDSYSSGVTLQDEIIHRNDGESTPRWKIAQWLRRVAAKL